MTINFTRLVEIFRSLQGEGPYAGWPMVFVRFQDCALCCRYCDTPNSFERKGEFRLESPPGSGRFVSRQNPVAISDLTEMIKIFDCPTLSLTGGEPLQHGAFLQHWLPQLKGNYKILLETNGVLVGELQSVIDFVDIVSMDFKLPSVTGMRPFWEEHTEFLKVARRKEVYVKVVISEPTEREELLRAISIVQKEAPEIPFILQPVTPTDSVPERVGQEQIDQFFEISKTYLPDVRVIPQLHLSLGLL